MIYFVTVRVKFQLYLEAKSNFYLTSDIETALLSSRDGYLWELTVWTQGSQAS